MTFWDTLLALAPDVLWKLNEGVGAVTALDSSGNGRDGSVVNSPTFGSASIINNEPTDTSMASDDTHFGRVQLADAAWMTATNITGFWAHVTYKPTAQAFTAQRDIIGKQDMWQLWQETDGKVTAYITPAWTALMSATALVAGTEYFILLRKTSLKWQIWLGTKTTPAWLDAETVHNSNPTDSTGFLMAGTSSVPPREYRGYMQGFAYKVGAIADADITALWTKWAEDANTPPTAPGPVTVPANGATYTNFINTAWGASTDAESNPIQYKGQYATSLLGPWTDAFPLQSGLTKRWNMSALANGAYYFRVIANDGSSDSAPSAVKGPFTISNPVSAPDAPRIYVVWRGDFSCRIASTMFGNPDADNLIDSAYWQIDELGGDFSTRLFDSGWETTNKVARYITGMPDPTAVPVLIARARFQDYQGRIGPWSNVIQVKATDIFTPGFRPWFARNRMSDSHHGTYGSVPSTYATFTPDSEPELGYTLDDLSDIGPLWNRYTSTGTFDQAATLRPMVVQWDDSSLKPSGSDIDHSFQWSVLISFFYSSDMVGIPMELWGFPTNMFIKIKADGTWSFVANQGNPNNADKEWAGGTLVADQVNIIAIGFTEGYQTFTYVVGQTCPNVDTSESSQMFYATNATTATDAFTHQQFSDVPYFDDELGEFKLASCGTAPDAPTWLDQPGHTVMHIGHGSSATNILSSFLQGGPVTKFMWWNDHALDATEYNAIRALLLAHTDPLEHLQGMTHPPFIYCELDEPDRPKKPIITAQKVVP